MNLIKWDPALSTFDALKHSRGRSLHGYWMTVYLISYLQKITNQF